MSETPESNDINETSKVQETAPDDVVGQDLDAGTKAEQYTGPETGPETGPDTGPDTGPETGPIVEPSSSLAEALEKWNVQMPAELVDRMQHYCQALWKQNEILNLTRHTNYDLFVTRDLVDAIHLSTHLLPDEEVLDIGSGGGVPGIPLAILRPDLRITLAESVGKKAHALEEVLAELKLAVTVFPERAEKILGDFRFDAGVARAVGSLTKLTQWFRGNWIFLGRLLAIKGPKWVDERTECEAAGLMKNLQLKVAEQYPIPGQEWESVILKIWPKGNREK